MIRRRVWWVTAALALSGCGASPTAPPTPAPGPPPVSETFTGTVAPYAIVFHTFAPARDGMATLTLRWSSAADIDLYVTEPSCTGYPPDRCLVLARSAASSGNEERVQVTVRAGASLRLWVDNFSPTDAVAYTLTAVVP